VRCITSNEPFDMLGITIRIQEFFLLTEFLPVRDAIVRILLDKRLSCPNSLITVYNIQLQAQTKKKLTIGVVFRLAAVTRDSAVSVLHILFEHRTSNEFFFAVVPK